MDQTRGALLGDVDGLDMFDRDVRDNVTRASYARFAEHYLHRVEWRCPCAREERRQVLSKAEEAPDT